MPIKLGIESLQVSLARWSFLLHNSFSSVYESCTGLVHLKPGIPRALGVGLTVPPEVPQPKLPERVQVQEIIGPSTLTGSLELIAEHHR